MLRINIYLGQTEVRQVSRPDAADSQHLQQFHPSFSSTHVCRAIVLLCVIIQDLLQFGPFLKP